MLFRRKKTREGVPQRLADKRVYLFLPEPVEAKLLQCPQLGAGDILA